MFWAINKNTKKRVNSLTKEFSTEFIKEEDWYADPTQIEECPNNISITEIPAVYRKHSKEIINYNGTIYHILPHFYIPNATKLGLKIKPSTEEHDKAVKIIYELLKNNKLKIKWSSENKPIQYENEIDISISEFDFELLDIEVRIKLNNSKIADVRLPFKEYHDLIGFGIIFEIQLSKQTEQTEIERTFERAIKGYSVCWIKEDEFDENMNYKKDFVIVKSLHEILNEFKQYSENKIKELTINYSKMIEEKEKRVFELAEKINTPDTINCSVSNCLGTMFKRKGKFGDYYHCYSCGKNISIGVKQFEKD